MHVHETKPSTGQASTPKTASPSARARPATAPAWERALSAKPLVDLKMPLQTKLTVNQPDDAFEQEADQVAATVMRMPAPRLQRATCACGGEAGPDGECAACRAKRLDRQLQRRTATAPLANTSHLAPPIVHQTLQSPGQPLDNSARSFMEARFGTDFGGVRVHSDPQAAASARAVNAHAYTVGQNVVFGTGQYAPHSTEGKQLLAHELAHVVQQSPAHSADRTTLSASRDSTVLQRQTPPSSGVRTEGLTPSEWQLIAQARTFFNLPAQPTESQPTIVGVLRIPGDSTPIFVKSGEEGGPWGGTQRGGIPRGPGTGFDRYTLYHVEGHTAAIMAQRGALEGELLLEKAFCPNCDRNIPQILPPGSRLVVVQPDSTSLVRSSQLVARPAAPPAVPPPAGGTTPTPAPPTTPAAPSTTQSGTSRGGTTARVGTPDMNPVVTGGPSASGVAKVGGALLGLAALGALLNFFADRVQRERLETQLRQIEPQIQATRTQNPRMGILIRTRYTKITNPESVIEGPTVFEDLDFAAGATAHEAELAVRSRPTIRRTLGLYEREFFQNTWIPPITPLSVAEIRTPFPKVALGTFAAGANRLQTVSFSISGFDDEGTPSLPIPSGLQVRFFILRVRARIPVLATAVQTPLLDVSAAAGGTIPVVNLDPINPFGSAKAACVFPADEATDTLFSITSFTLDGNLLSNYPNIYQARWIRPENIQVLERL